MSENALLYGCNGPARPANCTHSHNALHKVDYKQHYVITTTSIVTNMMTIPVVTVIHAADAVCRYGQGPGLLKICRGKWPVIYGDTQ